MTLPRGGKTVGLPQNYRESGQKSGQSLLEILGSSGIDPGPLPPLPPPHPGTLGISIPPSLRAWKTILEVIPFDLLLIPDNCLQS